MIELLRATLVVINGYIYMLAFVGIYTMFGGDINSKSTIAEFLLLLCLLTGLIIGFVVEAKLWKARNKYD